MRKLLLFGGTGFVGSRVRERALRSGWHVVCASRGGAPPNAAALSAEQSANNEKPGDNEKTGDNEKPGDNGERPRLDFVSLDATSRSQVFDFFADHADAAAVVSCVGRLTFRHAEARRACGDANVNIAAAVYERARAVRRVVLISVEPYGDALPLLRSRWMLQGYFHGKKMAERAVLENLGDRSAVLRPGFIHGTRYVAVGDGAVAVPLGAVGRPLEALLRAAGARGGPLTPPVSVDTVAEAAVRAAETGAPCGVLDYAGMMELCTADKQQVQKKEQGKKQEKEQEQEQKKEEK